MNNLIPQTESLVLTFKCVYQASGTNEKGEITILQYYKEVLTFHQFETFDYEKLY